jgi:RNA polymerase sigma factor (sigma-70 family)
MGISHLAEDVVQDTFIKLATMSAVRQEPIPNKIGYLIQSLRFRAIDVLRRENKKSAISMSNDEFYETVGDQNLKIEKMVYDNIENEFIWQQVKSILTERQLAIFQSSLEGYSRKEMAEYFDVTPNTVKSTLQQSQTRLRSGLLVA